MGLGRAARPGGGPAPAVGSMNKCNYNPCMVPGPKKGNGGGVWAIVVGLLPLDHCSWGYLLRFGPQFAPYSPAYRARASPGPFPGNIPPFI